METRTEQTLFTFFNRNSFAAKTAMQAIKNYNYDGIEKLLLTLHHYNLRSIGINDGATKDSGLLKEMVVKIINPS